MLIINKETDHQIITIILPYYLAILQSFKVYTLNKIRRRIFQLKGIYKLAAIKGTLIK